MFVFACNVLVDDVLSNFSLRWLLLLLLAFSDDLLTVPPYRPVSLVQ